MNYKLENPSAFVKLAYEKYDSGLINLVELIDILKKINYFDERLKEYSKIVTELSDQADRITEIVG